MLKGWAKPDVIKKKDKKKKPCLFPYIKDSHGKKNNQVSYGVYNYNW